MKFIVDEMPVTASDCPFYNQTTKRCNTTGNACTQFQDNGDLNYQASIYECDCLRSIETLPLKGA